MIKKIFLFLLFLLFSVVPALAYGNALEITISPENYIAGEQTLYLQGKSDPNARIFIFLKDNEEKTLKKWQVQSDSKGEWFLISKELIKSGKYNFFAAVEKNNELIFSGKKPVKVHLSGLFLFGAALSFKDLVFILAGLLAVSLIFFWITRIALKEKRAGIKREAVEARNVCRIVFKSLEEKIKKRIEMIDSSPGFSMEEKKAFDDLRKFLNAAESSIEKEIIDVEKLIK